MSSVSIVIGVTVNMSGGPSVPASIAYPQEQLQNEPTRTQL
jgi:hypothetical protein